MMCRKSTAFSADVTSLSSPPRFWGESLGTRLHTLVPWVSSRIRLNGYLTLFLDLRRPWFPLLCHPFPLQQYQSCTKSTSLSTLRILRTDAPVILAAFCVASSIPMPHGLTAVLNTLIAMAFSILVPVFCSMWNSMSFFPLQDVDLSCKSICCRVV